MAIVRNKTSYTGRERGQTDKLGDVYFDSTDFSVADDGKVSLSGTGAMEGLAGDSGTAAPVSGSITIAGTTNEINTVGSGSSITLSLDEAIPQTASVSLTAAEIKALATTPIQLVAAPGAGKVAIFMGASLKLVAGSEVLAEAGDNLGIKFTDASGVQVSATIESTGFIDQAANTYTSSIPANDAIVAATGAENQALVLDNLGSNFTGNASNDATLEISTLYRVVEI